MSLKVTIPGFSLWCSFCVVIYFVMDSWHCMFAFIVFDLVFSTKPRDWLGRTFLKWPILCQVGCKTQLNQVITIFPPLHLVELVGISSGSWYHCLPIRTCLWLWEEGCTRDRPKFGFGYGVSAETTRKYGFGLVSVTAKRNGRITVSDETWPRGDRNQP